MSGTAKTFLTPTSSTYTQLPHSTYDSTDISVRPLYFKSVYMVLYGNIHDLLRIYKRQPAAFEVQAGQRMINRQIGYVPVAQGVGAKAMLRFHFVMLVYVMWKSAVITVLPSMATMEKSGSHCPILVMSHMARCWVARELLNALLNASISARSRVSSSLPPGSMRPSTQRITCLPI